MAKGMRSKNKRANRSLLRTQLSVPLVNKAQQELAKRLVDDVKNQSGAKAIQKLKGLLAGKKATTDSREGIEHQKYAMDAEQPEDPQEKNDNKPVQQALVTIRKSSFSFRDVLDKDKEKIIVGKKKR